MVKENDWWEEWKTNQLTVENFSPPAPAPENWNHNQINFGTIIEKMFGKYEDKSAGLLAAEGKAIENAVAEIFGLRKANKRTILTDHCASGQRTLTELLFERKNNDPELIAKYITDCGPLIDPRWQEEISFDVLSPTKKPAGYFNRKFDLVTQNGIFEIKSKLPTNHDRIVVDLTMMSICWPVLQKGHVKKLDQHRKFRMFEPGESKSFSRISPKIGPTYAIVAPDGIVTNENIGLDMKIAKEYQAKFYEILLEMLAGK